MTPSHHGPRRVLIAAERNLSGALLNAVLGEAGYEVEWVIPSCCLREIDRDADYDAIVADLSAASDAAVAAIGVLADFFPATRLIVIAGSRPLPALDRADVVVRRPFRGDELVFALQTAMPLGSALSAAS